MEISSDDQYFISQLCNSSMESGVEKIIDVHLIRRKGTILLLLPKNVSLSLATLSLYKPQTLLARVFLFSIRSLVKLKLTAFLFSYKLKYKEGSVVAHAIARSKNERSQIGILLGNPDAVSRKAICIHEIDNRMVVSKYGATSEAINSVAKEYSSIENITYDGVLPILDCGKSTEFSFYSTPWIKGKSEATLNEIIGLLDTWKPPFNKPFSTSQTFTKVNQLLDLAMDVTNPLREAWNELEGLNLQCYPSHGDLAPWNVIKQNDGRIYLIDWEFFNPCGIQGWDIAHYITQNNLLVKKSPPSNTIKELVKFSSSELGLSFLNKTGWKENYNLWIASYLLYAHLYLKIDRTALIEAWPHIIKP